MCSEVDKYLDMQPSKSLIIKRAARGKVSSADSCKYVPVMAMKMVRVTTNYLQSLNGTCMQGQIRKVLERQLCVCES